VLAAKASLKDLETGSNDSEWITPATDSGYVRASKATLLSKRAPDLGSYRPSLTVPSF